MLALLVVLMACVFSTLDNAVTLRHASGTDIGQWPRLLLAFSGLAAGFVFDIRKRKYMGLIMYCVMMMSVLSIVVLNLGAPFLIGLVVFYLSSGFFVVFFTASFMELSRHMRLPSLWAGMGRAMNNVSAALITNGSVALLATGNSLGRLSSPWSVRGGQRCYGRVYRPHERRHGAQGAACFPKVGRRAQGGVHRQNTG